MAEILVEGRPVPGGHALGQAPTRRDAPRLSCGIVILNAQHELLLCHVTGRDHWDLPKGGMYSGESPIHTALRETREETGLALSADELLDLGRMPYRPKKDLHLFAALMPRFDAAQLQCEDRCYPDTKTIRRPPEMDGFGWMGFECIAESCMPKLAAVLNERLNLLRVLDTLRGRTGHAMRASINQLRPELRIAMRAASRATNPPPPRSGSERRA